MENYIEPTTQFDDLPKEEQAKILELQIQRTLRQLYDLGVKWQALELTEQGYTTHWTQSSPPGEPHVFAQMETVR